MIVPFNRSGNAQPTQTQPSQEMLLMALAHMKDIGRIPGTTQAAGTESSGLEKQVPTKIPTYDELKLQEKGMEEEQSIQDTVGKMFGGEGRQRLPKEQKI